MLASVFGPRLRVQPVADIREAYLEATAKSMGYVNFGPLDFLQPLELILNDLMHQSHLSPLGHIAAPFFIKKNLKMRLALNRAKESRAPTSLQRPIFILGLPRTGSSILQELLVQHPDLGAPTFWASHHWPRDSAWDLVTQNLTRAQIAVLDILAPTFRRVHALNTMSPHECVSIQGFAFRSMHFHVAFRLPSYNQAMMAEDFDWTPAYKLHADYLGLLPHAPNRWLLKAPGHMLGLDALIEQYPDALFVQTHRDPQEVIPSMASLTLSLRGLASNYIDKAEIGRDVDDLWHMGITKTMSTRAADDQLNRRFFDIRYQDLLADPVTTLGKVLKFADLAEPDNFDQLVKAHLQRRPKHQHGKHHYSAEQFHFQSGKLKEKYQRYTETYL